MSRIWAVARHTVAEGIRMKIALFFICLLLGLIVGLPFVARGDDTLSGAVQSFLAYSLAAVSLLLALLTLFMSRTLSDELVHRQILILMTKPLPRWQYILGKWLGIVLLDVLLLTLAGAGIYGMTRFIASRGEARDPLDRARLENQVLTARHHVPVEVPRDLFKQRASQLFEQRKEEGLYSDVTDFDPRKIKAKLERDIEASWRNVMPRDGRVFTFRNVLCDRSPEQTIQIRYKCQTINYPPDEVVRSRWIIGNPDRARAYEVHRRDVNGRFHTFSVPADAVAPDATLTVFFDNHNPFAGEPQWPNVLTFESDEAVEVLFIVGTFEGNLLRMLALVLFRLMFLAAVGLLATSVFSFPVASLVALATYVLAAFRGFISEALEWVGDEGAIGVFQTVFGLVLKTLWFIIPNLGDYSAADLVVDGRNVTLLWVLKGLVVLAGLQTAILLAFTCLLFHRREVSEVSI